MTLRGKIVEGYKSSNRMVIITRARKYYYIYYIRLYGKRKKILNSDRISSLREARLYARAWLKLGSGKIKRVV